MNILLYIVCVGYAIWKAYSLGFDMGEDRGRTDMINELTGRK